MTDFEKIVRLFSEAGIECVIVGGLAATIHGSARLTQDVDFVYARDRGSFTVGSGCPAQEFPDQLVECARRFLSAAPESFERPKAARVRLLR